jgi:hypothetical protein
VSIEEFIDAHKPCESGDEWLRTQPSLEAAYHACENPSWLLWAIGEVCPLNQAQSVTIAARCARLVLHLVPTGEERPRLAVEAAEAWLAEPTGERAAAAANAAARYAAAYAAANAAYAAAYYAAAYAAATYDAYAAATYDAYAAANAAYAAAYTANDNAIRKQCCDVIREVVPFASMKGGAK